MKNFRKSEEIKKELEKVYAIEKAIQATRDEHGDYQNSEDCQKHTEIIKKMIKLEYELKYAKVYEAHLNLKVGDGVSCKLFTDVEAFTVIKRTAKTITIQRDKAILDKNFKPEIIPCGFHGHCINQCEQTYTYERNLNGETYICRWSDKLNGFKNPLGCGTVTIGRHEFYDYNF